MSRLKIFLIFLFLGFLLAIHAQEDLKFRWAFKDVSTLEGISLLKIDTADYFLLNPDSTFAYELKAKNNLKAAGTWSVQNDSLLLNYNQPTDTTRYYHIVELNDTLLIINEGRINFAFSKPAKAEDTLPIQYE